MSEAVLHDALRELRQRHGQVVTHAADDFQLGVAAGVANHARRFFAAGRAHQRILVSMQHQCGHS